MAKLPGLESAPPPAKKRMEQESADKETQARRVDLSEADLNFAALAALRPSRGVLPPPPPYDDEDIDGATAPQP